jgi:hypothetical protein
VPSKNETAKHVENEHSLVKWTRIVALLTGVLGVIGAVTAWIFHQQLNVMQGQLDEMRVEQRPWVSTRIIGNMTLTRDSDELRVSGKFSMENIGKSPAQNARNRIMVVPFDVEDRAYQLGMIPNPEAKLKAVCDGFDYPMVYSNEKGFADMLFPGEKFDRFFSIGFRVDTFNTENRKTILLLLTCSAYRFVSDQSVHQTNSVFSLYRIGTTEFGVLRIDQVPISPSKIRVEGFPLSGIAN